MKESGPRGLWADAAWRQREGLSVVSEAGRRGVAVRNVIGVYNGRTTVDGIVWQGQVSSDRK